MKNVEGNKIVIEKANSEVWEASTDFLPEGFEKIIASTRFDATQRFKRLELLP